MQKCLTNFAGSLGRILHRPFISFKFEDQKKPHLVSTLTKGVQAIQCIKQGLCAFSQLSSNDAMAQSQALCLSGRLTFANFLRRQLLLSSRGSLFANSSSIQNFQKASRKSFATLSPAISEESFQTSSSAIPYIELHAEPPSSDPAATISTLMNLSLKDQDAVFTWFHTSDPYSISHLNESVVMLLHHLDHYFLRNGIVISDVGAESFFEHLRAANGSQLFNLDWLSKMKKKLYGSNIYPIPLKWASKSNASNVNEAQPLLRKRQSIVERSFYNETRAAVLKTHLDLCDVGQQTECPSIKQQWCRWIPPMQEEIEMKRISDPGCAFPKDMDSMLLAIITARIAIRSTYKPASSSASGKQETIDEALSFSEFFVKVAMEVGHAVNFEYNAANIEMGAKSTSAKKPENNFKEFLQHQGNKMYPRSNQIKHEKPFLLQTMRWTKEVCVRLGSALLLILLKHAHVRVSGAIALKQWEEENAHEAYKVEEEMLAETNEDESMQEMGDAGFSESSINTVMSLGKLNSSVHKLASASDIWLPSTQQDPEKGVRFDHLLVNDFHKSLATFPEINVDNHHYQEAHEELRNELYNKPYVTIYAFRHALIYHRVRRRCFGTFQLRKCCANLFHESSETVVDIPFQPMICIPRPWSELDVGGHLCLRTSFIRWSGSASYLRDARTLDLSRLWRIVSAIGEVPWKINKRTLEILQESYRQNLCIAGLPPGTDEDVPEKPSFRLEPSAYKNYMKAIRSAKMENMKRHSERPSFLLKTQCAELFKDVEALYFPHNIDFRGRMYPLSPHLNHLGNDISRGLLTFAQAKPLGKQGLMWLKIHLANLFGNDKLPFEKRIQWAHDHIPMIQKIYRDPLDQETRPLWVNSENPWQILSTSAELCQALSLEDPTTYCSTLPIHQDGSCNGLQHYAALGRDIEGGMAVNLLPSDSPRDVYSYVLHVARDRIKKDLDTNSHLLAKECFQQNLLVRKVIKQTVMTICYGVTSLGAKDQVKRALVDIIGKETDVQTVSKLATYISRHILGSVGDVFKQAMQIKKWLDQMSRLCNAVGLPVVWVTPLGLPCQQPYIKKDIIQVPTALQTISITDPSPHGLKVNKSKQRLGFPPNFIHSLDASHLMQTAEKCLLEDHVNFVGVHDSYWTHAADVDTLNRRIREEFIHLYKSPILSNLYTLMKLHLGNSTGSLPLPPTQGNLDLERVKESRYFFH
ncbi:Dna-dependent Rna polymerase [Cardiosporidium cionae]|uniref:DNA-directed RNA polymerase n=1 Tax=Cardiosporidium cionae TaxID=476202 RepID=A0ABQ7JGQ4_9APIC|nr:Dna-dependent Rna polymerase [Cardiosporidium cionae]|eukprot:KAF8822865.1 Dna-dependent Rna polymerase [Cardiosporidium cionae]